MLPFSRMVKIQDSGIIKYLSEKDLSPKKIRKDVNEAVDESAIIRECVLEIPRFTPYGKVVQHVFEILIIF
jgi:hypothetical protein